MFQILSLSGGGYLGLYTAEVLARIEEASGQPVADHFDLIAGTSIGGIIALGLAAGKPASSIRDAIAEHGPKIFSSTNPGWLRSRFQFALDARGARYGLEDLRAAIEEILDQDLRIGDLGRCIIVPVVNLTKGQPQVFKTPHHPNFVRDLHVMAVDVALATSAAPTYFPIHRIEGELFADGGLYANAPDLLALHEAEHFFERGIEEVRVLSVGTTTSNFSFSLAGGLDMGWMGWMSGNRLTRVMIAAQQSIVSAMMNHRLGERYIRIDRTPSPEQERQLGLDVATVAARSDLAGLAEATVREQLPKEPLASMLNHEARPLAFYRPTT